MIKLLQNKFYKFFFIATIICSLLFAFQNCSDVALDLPTKISSPAILKKDQISMEICPIADVGISTPMRLVVIMDMSMSNLGVVGQPWQPAYCGGQSMYPIDFSLGTDTGLNPPTAQGSYVGAKRILGVKNFLSQIDDQEGMGYSVLGFSTDSMLGDTTLTCATSFTTDKSRILSPTEGVLKKFDNIQYNDKIRGDGGQNDCSSGPPFIMGLTSYYSAFKCLDSAISADLFETEESHPHYQIFFLTDGRPDERNIFGNLSISNICGGTSNACATTLQACKNLVPGCTNVNDCIWEPAVQMCIEDYITNSIYKPQLQALLAKITNIEGTYSFKPIFYGKEEDQARAKILLDILANADGSGTQSVPIDNLDDLTNELKESLGVQATANYTFNLPVAYNLNAIPQGSNVVLDSDMDGVSDALEEELGWDPLNPRSKGILDGLCYHFFTNENNWEACTPAVPADCNIKVGLGLSKCDQSKFRELVPDKELTGFDSDKDGIVDFMEIIRKTNPLFSDKNLDDDRDGIKNVPELAMGADPFSDLEMFIGQIISVSGSSAPNFSQCSFEGMMLTSKLENISYVSGSVGYAAATGNIFDDFNYQPGENVVLLTFFAETAGITQVKKALYTAVLKVNSNGTYDVSGITVGNDGIKKIGEF